MKGNSFKIFAVLILVLVIGVLVFVLSKSHKEIKLDPAVVNLEYTESYTVERYGASFVYPKGFKVLEITEGEGDSIVIQNERGTVGVQMTIQPVGAAIKSVSIQDVKDTFPHLVIKESQEVEIGTEGKGVAFIAEGTNFGTSREVWFVHKGNMYQMSTYLQYDRMLQTILNSWKFI